MKLRVKVMRRWWTGVAGWICLFSLPAFGQQPAAGGAAPPATEAAPTDAPAAPEPIPLLDREPFDVIKLNAENRNFVAELLPLEVPRPVLPPSARRGKLRFRLLEDDGLEYECDWAHIVDVKFFETLLFEQAQRLMAAGDLDQAYRYYTRLKREYPRYPGLETALDDFLFADSLALFKAKSYAESLSVMEELYRRNPNYRNNSLPVAMGRLVDQIIASYVGKGDFRSGRIILDRLADKYASSQPETIRMWRQRLDNLATTKLNEARQHLSAQKYREAITSIRQALDISPTVPGGRELELTLATTYPQVIVGVTQPALTFDAGRIDNWAARRTGRLVHRTLVEFLGAGSEGGEYEFPSGAIERSPDGRRLTFRLNQFSDGQTPLLTNGYDLSKRLLELANPRSSEYREDWGGLMSGVTVDNVLRVDVDLRRSHVLPTSLLRVPLAAARESDGSTSDQGNGSFRVDAKTDAEVRFMAKQFTAGSRLAEIIEVPFSDAQAALNALRRGQIDVIDRVFPSDAGRLQSSLDANSQWAIQPYALPTVHLLIPTSDNPFLANTKFRRALEFGIDRERILTEELLGGQRLPGCRVISGPFPAGIDQSDPLGYAYDHDLPPRRWDPRVAKLLTIMAENDLTIAAERVGEEPPRLTPLLIAHPANEPARVAVQGMIAYLAVCGIEVKAKELPPGQTTDPDGECDLLYAEIAIWEPVADARKLLGPTGVAPSDSPYVAQALRRLDAAESWGAVRDQLVALHRSVHNEVSVIPLWQTVDYFVYNKRLRNLGDRPVWLYQNVDQWRLQAQTADNTPVDRNRSVGR